MKKPETKFRESTHGDLNKLKYTWWESIQQSGIRGTPDILLCIRGRFVGLEYKASSKDKPTKLQSYKHTKIRRAKGKVYVVHPGNWKRIYRELVKLSKDYTSK